MVDARPTAVDYILFVLLSSLNGPSSYQNNSE